MATSESPLSMKRLAILFTLFLVTVILLADLGYMRIPLRLLHTVPYGDKIMHFLLIGTLNFLATASLIQSLPNRDPKWIAVTTGLVLTLIFTVEEWSQEFFRGREASLGDLLANYAGILLFGFTAWLVTQKRLKK